MGRLVDWFRWVMETYQISMVAVVFLVVEYDPISLRMFIIPKKASSPRRSAVTFFYTVGPKNIPMYKAIYTPEI